MDRLSLSLALQIDRKSDRLLDYAVARVPLTMTDHQLARKLILFVLIKLVLLFGLWWAFIRGQQVEVSSETMARAVQPEHVNHNNRPQQPQAGETPHGH